MHDYELGKQEIDVSLFDDETRNIWCFKVTHKRTTKVVQTKSDSKTIAEHQTKRLGESKNIHTHIKRTKIICTKEFRGETRSSTNT